MPALQPKLRSLLTQSLYVAAAFWPIALWIGPNGILALLSMIVVGSIGATALSAAACAALLPPQLCQMCVPATLVVVSHIFLVETADSPELYLIDIYLIIATAIIPSSPPSAIDLSPSTKGFLPEFPREIRNLILSHLATDWRTLHAVSLASWNFNISARLILFQDIYLHSTNRIYGLADLVSAEDLCTIPQIIDTLTIRLPTHNNAIDGWSLDGPLDLILEHFKIVKTTFVLDIPWLTSRMLDTESLKNRASLRRFVLSGAHCWDTGFFQGALSEMVSLESLVIDATWKLGARSHSTALAVFSAPPNLKELCLSPSTLVLMRWFMASNAGLPALHVVRLKVDGSPAHQEHFTNLVKFFKRFGSKLKHLYVWFEGHSEDVTDAMAGLAAGLTQLPLLHQLELFLPFEDWEEELQGIVNLICSSAHPENVHAWHGFEILSEDDFWGNPSSCGEDGVHNTLRMLARHS